MQAILQGKHNRFCAWLQDNKNHPAVNTKEITLMENELQTIYKNYRIEMDNLRAMIDHYEQIKKSIRTRVKENMKELKELDNRAATKPLLLGTLQ